MKVKYIREKLNGTLVYPDCPNVIKSKEDLQRWFEHTDQYYSENIDDKSHLLKYLPTKFIKEQTDTEIKIMFPRCKTTASAIFNGIFNKTTRSMGKCNRIC